MKRVLAIVLTLALLSTTFMLLANAAELPSVCSTCGAHITTERLGEKYTIKSGETTVGNTHYFIYETRQPYTVICTNNHSVSSYYVVSTEWKVAWYI